MKVAEGQLELLQHVAEQLRTDKSLAGELIREYIDGMVKDQAVAPDVLPNTVHIKHDKEPVRHPDVSPDSGRVVDRSA
ncbi:hypothetical protein [Fundidesulfovibrio terrae]|uniref:hypothetical protein n=1 Tax=Fundidesulfovibrio terrae TaxID=2922866 RepID=UPI001FAF0978|nr:hypothetical protein [Fundidesulfovibrio terrae]